MTSAASATGPVIHLHKAVCHPRLLRLEGSVGSLTFRCKIFGLLHEQPTILTRSARCILDCDRCTYS